jgi:hypothetical protein
MCKRCGASGVVSVYDPSLEKWEDEHECQNRPQTSIGKVMLVENLRWISGLHFEGDEFGALNELLTAAPAATPCGADSCNVDRARL